MPEANRVSALERGGDPIFVSVTLDGRMVADLIRVSGCSRAHAYRLLERGAVPFAAFGGTRYIRRRDLEHFLHEIAPCRTDGVSRVQVSFSRATGRSGKSEPHRLHQGSRCSPCPLREPHSCSSNSPRRW